LGGIWGGWAIPPSTHGLMVAVGGISEKPALINGEICLHEYLHLTFVFDHNIVDGAPAARFISELRESIEEGKVLSFGKHEKSIYIQ